ncbi:hypothetical protein DIPPA_10775 [Diplonema papillatum]|nr:hypothetical protein DIPPA_10775 [Diplonema papillatum]
MTTTASQARQVMMASHLRAAGNSPYNLCPSLPKLSKEQLNKSVERLHKTKQPPKDPPPIVETKQIPGPQLHNSIERLHSQAHQREKARKAALEKKLVDEAALAKTLPPEELEESLRKVFTQAIKSKQANRAALKAKYCIDQPKRKLEKEQQKEANERLYNKQMEQRKERAIKLEEKYIVGTLKPPAKRTNRDWEATIGRLTTPK